MPQEWKLGDEIDFGKPDNTCDIEEYYLIECLQCGRVIAVCGCCLQSGLEGCPCSGEPK